ncbi:MAG: hypothetical protein Q9225_004885 [Loekoesia sp. 1 TL-2023]
MYFLKQLSIAVALGFALVDARAVNVNGKRDVGTQGVTAGSNQPRAVDRPAGKKLDGRGLFGFGSDVEVNKDASKEQAERCKSALNKLRKLRKLRKAKRADDGSDLEMDDQDDGHDMLGDKSYTVDMGEHMFISEDEADDEDIKILGTYGLNSCSGVLIVGDKGYAVAHLNPIEGSDEDATVADDDSKQEFKDNVANMVEKDYNDNKDNLGNAVMYIMTPSDGLGEQDELAASAGRLGIKISKNTYDVADDATLDSKDYSDKERGTIYVDFSDKVNPKIKVNGNDPAAAE